MLARGVIASGLIDEQSSRAFVVTLLTADVRIAT